MSRKVFISVLGTGFYGQCQYGKDNFCSSSTRFVQVATLEWLNAKAWSPEDQVLICLTKGARKLNWAPEAQERINTWTKLVESYVGLEAELQTMDLPFNPKGVDILEGSDEKEIWKIFDTIFAQIEEGDELYFDLTHGFRYLPMLVLVLGNYARFLRNAVVKCVSYGNFEMMNRETNVAPIIDLLPLISLQEWTYAAGQFLETGNVQPLKKVSDSHLKPLLKEAKGSNPDLNNARKLMDKLTEVVEMMRTCRGISIVNGADVQQLKALFDAVSSTQVNALNPILDRVRGDFSDFVPADVRNGYEAAKWCMRNGLYQQAATILQESIISLFCVRHAKDIDEKAWRELFGNACTLRQRPEMREKTTEAAIMLCEQLAKDEWFTEGFAARFNQLGNDRNDFNHAGMRKIPAPLPATTIKKHVEEAIEYFAKYFT